MLCDKGTAFHSRLKARSDILPKTLVECLAGVFDPININITPKLISTYGFAVAATENSQETTKTVLDFMGDAMFALPARHLTQLWSLLTTPGSKAYLYHFECPNPWDGSWKGNATHALDIALVLQNYKVHVPQGQQQCSERFAKDLIAFVNGGDPWPEYQESDGVAGAMVYKTPIDAERDQSEFMLDGTPEMTGRKSVLAELGGEDMLDKIVDACQQFLTGPHT